MTAVDELMVDVSAFLTDGSWPQFTVKIVVKQYRRQGASALASRGEDGGESNSSHDIRPCSPSCVSAEFSYVSAAAQFASIRPCSLALGAESGASARSTPPLTCESRPGNAAGHGFHPPTGDCLWGWQQDNRITSPGHGLACEKCK